MSPITGHCLCGAVHYRLQPPTDFASHCHCASCRRASGAAFLTWTSVPRDRAEIEGTGAIRWYRTSPSVQWGFCGTCGTTLFYAAASTDRLYVTVATLSDPLDREVSEHVSFEEHVPWFTPGDALPKHVGKGDATLPPTVPHFILYVADQAVASAFYTAVLGISPRLDVPGMTELALPGGGVLGLMPEAGIRRLVAIDTGCSRTSRAELYLRMPDPLEAHRRALEAGGTELAPAAPRGWGETVSYVRDPDGHVLALAGPTPLPDGLPGR